MTYLLVDNVQSTFEQSILASFYLYVWHTFSYLINSQKVRTKTSHRGQKSNCHFQTVLLFRYLHQSPLKLKVQMVFFFFSDCRVTGDFILCLAWCPRATGDHNKQVCWSVNWDSKLYFVTNMRRTWFSIIRIQLFDSMDHVRVQQIHVILVISYMQHFVVCEYSSLCTRQTT